MFTVLHAELFTLTYKDITGEAYEIKVSGEHPFWVADKGWVSARQLAINDRLEITDNTYVAVTGLTSEPAKLGETFTTYNFEVDDFHTYFVLQEGKTNGAFAVLVHNSIPCGVLKEFDVGLHKNLKGRVPGLDSHHVGQKKLMKKFIPDYDPENAPAILVNFIGHTKSTINGVVLRSTKGIKNVRQLIARDIFELRRVYPNVPNSQLKKLINMNKEMYSQYFIKGQR